MKSLTHLNHLNPVGGGPDGSARAESRMCRPRGAGEARRKGDERQSPGHIALATLAHAGLLLRQDVAEEAGDVSKPLNHRRGRIKAESQITLQAGNGCSSV